ncbi:MAG TPA: 4-(cytidine 5'-diphospho)-2-C-methyl-D-erythritol kinase [Anaerohalosphaeraceae bacterium]|nr:4-(cytidine 5'-diphospho)-2-C-methyl-D-erythritol kinase [Anaerohalosphaeraceae bacterium]
MEQFHQTANGLTVLAPAKINLTLLIAGKRPDGYHELESVMAKIDYCDQLDFQWGTAPGIELVCTGPFWAPDGPDNLVWRAARLLLDKAQKDLSVKITLTKNIPAGTGLGSGSSDAAATLLGLNRFAQLEVSHADIHAMAASLGSDVNFFLEGPLAFCTGRGEKISPISVDYPFEALLIIPNVNTSTKKVYGNYSHDSQRYSLWASQINEYLDKNRVDFAVKMCANMLQESCFRLHPDLAAIHEQAERLTGRKVCLSGSGSAMYCLLEAQDSSIIQRCCDTLKTNFNCVSRIVHNNRW